MAERSDLVRTVVSRLEQRLAARRRRQPSKWTVTLVVIALAVGVALAVRSLPDDLETFAWWPIAIMAIATIPGIALNGYEYAVSVRIGGGKVGFLPALRIALYGTAANLLPIPGASIVRIEAMRSSGTRLGRATAATVAVGVCWVGVSLLLAAAVLLPRGFIGLPFLAGGVACMGVVVAVIRRGADPAEARVNLLLVTAVEAGFVTIGALKLGLALVAIGAPFSMTTAFTLAVSTSIAAATGFLPGGLGIREAMIAALGPLVGVEPPTAFLAAVVDRILTLSVVAIVAAVVLNLRDPAATPDVEAGVDPPAGGGGSVA